MHRVVLLLVDGLRPDVAEELLAAGALPNLAAMVRQGGAGRALTVFPSTSIVAYLPFLTGCTPGRCNVPSIRWLDRTRYGGRWWRERGELRSYCGWQADRLDDDLSADVRTIFELVPESVGLFSPVTRGLLPARDPTRRSRKRFAALAHYVLLLQQRADNIVAHHLLQEIERPWRFVFAQFPAVDAYTHRTTPDSALVTRAVRRVDAVVGKLCARLVARGEFGDTLILLVSDHGASPVHTHFDLGNWFRGHGVTTLTHPEVWTRNPRAAVMVAGNGFAMVYANPGRRRLHRLSVRRLRSAEAFGCHHDLVYALAREPAVAFVAGESGDGGLTLISRDGDAEVRRLHRHVLYRPRTGDPLGLGGPRVGTDDQWLACSASDLYPDAAVQILQLFRSPR